jgi:hypothetical protein
MVQNDFFIFGYYTTKVIQQKTLHWCSGFCFNCGGEGGIEAACTQVLTMDLRDLSHFDFLDVYSIECAKQIHVQLRYVDITLKRRMRPKSDDISTSFRNRLREVVAALG